MGLPPLRQVAAIGAIGQKGLVLEWMVME